VRYLVRIERMLSDDREIVEQNYPMAPLPESLRIQYAAECKEAVECEGADGDRDLLPLSVEVCDYVPARSSYTLLARFTSPRTTQQFVDALQRVHYDEGHVAGHFRVLEATPE
jgi:protein-disulfide isomerase-like protein with CxxC motif